MSTTPITSSAGVAQEMLQLATAQTSLAQVTQSADSAAAFVVQAKTIDAVRSQLRPGETFSVKV
jgi:hypothetical protein